MEKYTFKQCTAILYACRISYCLDKYYFITVYLHTLIIKAKLKEKFIVKTVPYELCRELARENRADISNSVFINNRYWKHILNSVSYISLYDTLSSRERVVSVYPINISPNILLMSFELFHNLNFKIKQDVKIKRTNYCTQKIATEIDISLISSPYDFNNATVDLLIKNYFKVPKLLYKNDIICVNFKHYGRELTISDIKLNETNYAYFKCNNIGCESVLNCKYGYFCVIGETAIKQSSNIQDYLVPRTKTMCLFNTITSDIDRLVIDSIPHGLNEYSKEIESSVTPFISEKRRIKPIFLLEGDTVTDLLVETVAEKLAINLYKLSCGEISGTTYLQTETKLKNCFFRCKSCSPCILHLTNFEQFGRNNEYQYDIRIINNFKVQIEELFKDNEFPIIIICSFNNTNKLSPDLERIFLNIIDIEPPSKDDRLKLLRWLLNRDSIRCEEETLRIMSEKTSGFIFEDYVSLIYYARKIRYEKVGETEFEWVLEREELEESLEMMHNDYNESIGAPKVPKVQWSDIGGLSDVKEEIIKTINFPLKHPELLKTTGLKRSGILLYGPPGTGKTLIAKAVATECNLCFLSVKGPELLNMYIGQSEQNVREVFKKARQASPCIIFFDELDSLAPNRGAAGDSGGVMDRIVSQLLAEMDGVNKDGIVFIVGATNRPDLIDPSLLRPGRFDKLLYVGPCTDFDSKLSVLQALTRKFKFSGDISMEHIIKACPENLTGADFYGLCSSAWMNAAKRVIRKLENDGIEPEGEVAVCFEDFQEAMESIKPSISEKDLTYFSKLKEQYSGVLKK